MLNVKILGMIKTPINIIKTKFLLKNIKTMKYEKKMCGKKVVNLFIYGSFMTGQVNHKYLKEYIPIKAILRKYRRSWPRNKDTAILIKSSLGSVKGELYLNVKEKDILRIIRLHGIPHDYTTKNVIVNTIKNKQRYEAVIFYPNDDIIRQWLSAEENEKNLLVHFLT